MSKVPELRVLGTALVVVLLLALAVAVGPSAQAITTEVPCAYTGHAFVDGVPVPAGTGIRVLENSTVIGDTTTGLWLLDDNEYYVDGVMAECGTEVNFEIWVDGSSWVPAVETAIHVSYGLVEVDLHAGGVEPIHINVNPFLFVYPGPDCPLPEALTNIGPDGLDVVIIVWGTAEVESVWQWVSFDPVSEAGLLGDLGLENGKAYVMQVTGEGVCNDWEMCVE